MSIFEAFTKYLIAYVELFGADADIRSIRLLRETEGYIRPVYILDFGDGERDIMGGEDEAISRLTGATELLRYMTENKINKNLKPRKTR